MIIRIIIIASVIVCRLYENTPWSGCKECAGQMGANGCDIQGYGQAAHIPFTIEGQCEIAPDITTTACFTNLAKKGLSTGFPAALVWKPAPLFLSKILVCLFPVKPSCL